VGNSRSLPGDVRTRLIRLAGRRITQDGILIIEARQFRTQERNREDAVDRLKELIRLAAVRPKQRKKDRPSLAAKEKDRGQEAKEGGIKKMRSVRPGDGVNLPRRHRDSERIAHCWKNLLRHP